jgi:hypothetical protein
MPQVSRQPCIEPIYATNDFPVRISNQYGGNIHDAKGA